MTLVVHTNALFQARGSAVALAPRRRRLSTIMARQGAHGRAIPLVFRKGVDWQRVGRAEIDSAARMRAQYATTLVGPHDTVVLYRPVRGGQAGGIGMILATIVLTAVAGPLGAAIAGPGSLGAFAIKAGIAIGAAALSFAANRAKAAKKSTEQSFGALSGGGNVPKVGDRRPLIYGKCWTTPPLSQKDYFAYLPNSTVVYKRMTLGIGQFQVHQVRVGESLFWDEASGIQPPFNQPTLYPGFETALEVLYEQPSTLIPGDFIDSASVGGQEFPRPNTNPSVTPWFRLTPQGVVASRVQMSWQFLSISYTSSAGTAKAQVAGVQWEIQRLAPGTGNPTGPVQILATRTVTALMSSPWHLSEMFDLPEPGEWQVRGRNLYPENPAINSQNAATWDAMTAIVDNTRIRAKTTEIAMRVSGGKGLPISALSDVQVLATRMVDVWNGSAWVRQPSRQAVWALADLIREEHGLDQPAAVDIPRFAAYASRADLAGFDEFNGVLPSVSSFWEAAGEILAPLRAEPIKIGTTHSFVRDESALEAGGRQIISRRHIVADTSSQEFEYTTSESENGDVVLDYDRDGDPKRPDEARQTVFAQTRTPKRYRINGITRAEHAVAVANWLAARSMFRGDRKKLTTEWDGRLLYPGMHVAVDLWFIEGRSAVGVDSFVNRTLILDSRPGIGAGDTYCVIRTRKGREWGILPCTYNGDLNLALNNSALQALISNTGMGLADVLARETQDPTTVMIGSLAELQDTYIVTSAIPSGTDYVDVELMRDDSRVWQALGEAVAVPPPPVGDAPVDLERPNVTRVSAYCRRIETNIELVWGISTSRGAARYSAELSYDDGASWEVIQDQLTNQGGHHPIHQSDDPIVFRGRAFGTTGLPGEWVQTTFSTIAPAIDAKRTEVIDLGLDAFNATLREIFEGEGPGTFGGLETAVTAAKGRADDAFDVAEQAVEDLVEAARLRGATSLALSSDRADRGLSSTILSPLDPARSARDDIETLIEVLTDLQGKVLETQGRLSEIGVTKTEGAWKLAGQAQLETRLTSVGITVDALAGKVALLASTFADGNFDGLIDQITSISIALDAINQSLSLKVDTASITGLTGEVESLSITLDGLADEIELKATKTTVEALQTTVSDAEIKVNALGTIVAQVSSASAAVDQEMRDLTIDQLLDRISKMEGSFTERIANASQTLAARTDKNGDSIAEVGRTATAISGQVAAFYTELVQTIATKDFAQSTVSSRLNAQVGNATTGLVATRALVLSEQTARATADTAEASARQGVEAVVNNPTTGLAATRGTVMAEQATRATADTAEATSRQGLEAVVNGPSGLPNTRALLLSEQSTRATADTAEVTSRQTLDAFVKNPTTGLTAAMALIVNEQSTRATADTSETTARQLLSSQVNNPTTGLPATRSAVLNEQATRATADTAEASARQLVFAQVNDPATGLPAAQSKILTEQTTRATALTTEATLRQALVSQITNPTTGLAATYAIALAEQTNRLTADTANLTKVQVLEGVVYNAQTGLPYLRGRVLDYDNILLDGPGRSALVTRFNSIEAEVAGTPGDPAKPSLSAKIQTAQKAAVDAAGNALSAYAVQAEATVDKITGNGRRSVVVQTNQDGSNVIIADQVSRYVDGTEVFSGGTYTILAPDGTVRHVIDANQFFVGKLVNGQLLQKRAMLYDTDRDRLIVPNLEVTGDMLASGVVSTAGNVGAAPAFTFATAGGTKIDDVPGAATDFVFYAEGMTDIELTGAITTSGSATNQAVTLGLGFRVYNVATSALHFDSGTGGIRHDKGVAGATTVGNTIRRFVRVAAGVVYRIQLYMEYTSFSPNGQGRLESWSLNRLTTRL